MRLKPGVKLGLRRFFALWTKKEKSVMRNVKVRNLVLLAILGAWSLVLRLFDFPILPAAPFLKIDFSDLMALIGMLINGPIGLITVALVRDLLNYIIKGGEAGVPIGAIMSMTATIVMFLPTHFILNKFKSLKWSLKALLMSATLTISLVIAMVLLNYYVALPIYTTVLNFPIDDFFAYIMAIIVPFNLIKGLFLSVGQILVIKYIPKILNERNMIYYGYNKPSYN